MGVEQYYTVPSEILVDRGKGIKGLYCRNPVRTLEKPVRLSTPGGTEGGAAPKMSRTAAKTPLIQLETFTLHALKSHKKPSL